MKKYEYIDKYYWNVYAKLNRKGGITELFELLYKIHYQYGMLAVQPFMGMPIRKENLIKKLEDDGQFVFGKVVSLILKVFNLYYKNFIKPTYNDKKALKSTPKWVLDRFENLNKIRAELADYKGKSFADQIALIQKAINTMHLNGNMLEHLKSFYPDLDKTFFDNLSNIDTSNWDEELREWGVKV